MWNIPDTVYYFSLFVCMKLGHHKDTKVTEPDIFKEAPYFLGFLMILAFSQEMVIAVS